MREQLFKMGFGIGEEGKLYLAFGIGQTHEECAENTVLLRPLQALKFALRVIPAAVYGLLFKK